MPEQVQILIRCARELAALAEKATPGPWEWEKAARGYALWCPGSGKYIHAGRIDFMPEYCPEALANMEILAAAPEMARLLAEMADALECLEKQLEVAAKEISTTPDGDMCPSDYDGELTCTCNGTIADVYRCWRERWRQKVLAVLEGGNEDA